MMLLDLVIMPLTEISLFMSSGFKSLMTLCSAMLKGRTCMFLELNLFVIAMYVSIRLKCKVCI